MKKNDELLGSGAWYFVNVKELDWETTKRIMDEKEYSDFFRQLNWDNKFVKIGNNHYFWSNVHSFWPIEFEEGVLTQIKNLSQDFQWWWEHVKKLIRSWKDISTMDKLRSEFAFFNSKDTL